MDHGRGLQGVPRGLLPEVPAGNLAELAVHDLDQPRGGIRGAVAKLREEPRHRLPGGFTLFFGFLGHARILGSKKLGGLRDE